MSRQFLDELYELLERDPLSVTIREVVLDQWIVLGRPGTLRRPPRPRRSIF